MTANTARNTAANTFIKLALLGRLQLNLCRDIQLQLCERRPEGALARDLTDFFKVGHIEVAYAQERIFYQLDAVERSAQCRMRLTCIAFCKLFLCFSIRADGYLLGEAYFSICRHKLS